jgi:hypothetical protein
VGPVGPETPTDQVPSPLQNVEDEALVPLLRLVTAKLPVIFDAVPVVFWFNVGTSAATSALNVGAPAVPLGAAKI